MLHSAFSWSSWDWRCIEGVFFESQVWYWNLYSGIWTMYIQFTVIRWEFPKYWIWLYDKIIFLSIILNVWVVYISNDFNFSVFKFWAMLENFIPMFSEQLIHYSLVIWNKINVYNLVAVWVDRYRTEVFAKFWTINRACS